MRKVLVFGLLSLTLVGTVGAVETKTQQDRKMEIVARQAQRLCELNARKVEEAKKKVARLDAILEKFQIRIKTGNGSEGLERAKAEIAKAKMIATEQINKNSECEIRIKDKKKMKIELEEAREKRKSELRGVVEQVNSARDALKKVIKSNE